MLGSDDLLISSEKVVVQAITVWNNYNYENRDNSLDELLPQIRFQRKVDVSGTEWLFIRKIEK